MAKKEALKGFSPLRRYKNDDAAVEQGVWREVEGGAAKLLIARFNNSAHQEYLRAERVKHANKLSENSKDNDDFLIELGNRAMSKHILKGWEGILDEDGVTPLPFNEDNAYKLLSEVEEFSTLVFNLSMDAEQYRLYREEDAVKN